MPLPLVPDDGTNGANDLIAKIDELVQHRHRPEPKTISQIVYERYHPFEAFEETLQDAWELGEPVRREKAGMGCCSDKKPSAPSSGCGCGPKTPQTKSGGCGCGPKKGDPERIEGGGCGCSAPTVPSPTGKSKKLEDLTLVDKDIANKIYRNASWKDRFIIASVKAGFLDQKILKAVAERTGGLDLMKEIGTEIKEQNQSNVEPVPGGGCHSSASGCGGAKNIQVEIPRAISGGSARSARFAPDTEEEEVEPIAISWKKAPVCRTQEVLASDRRNLMLEAFPLTNIPDITPVRTHSSNEEFTIKWKNSSRQVEQEIRSEPLTQPKPTSVETAVLPPPPPPLPPVVQHPLNVDEHDDALSEISRNASGGGHYIRYSCRACRLPIMPIMPPGRINPSLYRAAARTSGAGFRGKSLHRGGKKRRGSIRRKSSGSEIIYDDLAFEEPEWKAEGKFCTCANPVLTPIQSKEDLFSGNRALTFEDDRPKPASASVAVATTESLVTTVAIKEERNAPENEETGNTKNEYMSDSPNANPGFGYPNQGDQMMPTAFPAGFMPVFMTYNPASQCPQFTFGMQPGMAAPMIAFPPPQFFSFPGSYPPSPNRNESKQNKPLVEEVKEPRVDEFESQPPSPSGNPEVNTVETRSPMDLGAETNEGVTIIGKPGALASWLEKQQIHDALHKIPEIPTEVDSSTPHQGKKAEILERKMNLQKTQESQSGWFRMQRFLQDKLNLIGGTKLPSILGTPSGNDEVIDATPKPSVPKRTTCTTPVRYADELPPTHPRYLKEKLKQQNKRPPVPINFKPAPKLESTRSGPSFKPQQRVPPGPWNTSLDPMPLALPRPVTVVNTTGRLDVHQRPKQTEANPALQPLNNQEVSGREVLRDLQVPYPSGHDVETYAVTDVVYDDPERLLDIYMKKDDSIKEEKAGISGVHEAGDCIREPMLDVSLKLKDSSKSLKSTKSQPSSRGLNPKAKITPVKRSSDVRQRVPLKNRTAGKETIPVVHQSPSSTCLCDTCETRRQKLDRFMKILKGPVIDIQELKTCCWSGVPHQIRPAIWKILSSFLPLNIQLWDEFLLRRRTKYWNYVHKHFDAVGEAYEEIRKQIRIDLPRMRLAHPMLELPEMIDIYDRVLFVWALRHPNAGYVQGLNDLLTPFIMVFAHEYVPHEMIESQDPSIHAEIGKYLQEAYVKNIEADAYWCFKNLLKNIQSNYTASQPGIQLSVILMEDLVRRVDPELHSHLANCGVEYLQFAFRWMNNLLMRELPLNCFIRLWDTCIAEPDGFTTFYVYLYTALLRTFRETILSSSDFQTLLMFLQNLPTSDWTEKDVVKLIANAYKLKYAESVAQHSGNPDKIEVEGESGTSLEKEKPAPKTVLKRTKPLASKGVIRRG